MINGSVFDQKIFDLLVVPCDIFTMQFSLQNKFNVQNDIILFLWELKFTVIFLKIQLLWELQQGVFW